MKLYANLSRKKIISILAILFILFQLILNRKSIDFKSFFVSPTPSPTCTGQACLTPTITLSTKQLIRVVRVIDGDTIEIEDGQKVRYIGINSPELHDPRRPVGCFAKQSYEENKKLVEGKTITMERDISETDKYKRLLRYVWIGDVLVNDYLVRQGFALTSTFPPDVKYETQFLEAETEARENNPGLWFSCPSKQK